MTALDCEAVIVGSGAGGATMAAELAEAGLDVVLIEEGGHHRTEEFGAQSLRALRTLYRGGGGGGVTIGRPSVAYAEGCCVGGSTVINGGMSWRTPDKVLARWAGEDGIAAIQAAEMAPFFDEVEQRLSVGLQDPETIGRDLQLFRAGARALGWEVIASRRNQRHCAGSNNCGNGCPTGAKQSMLVTAVPRAVRAGARLIPGCRVERIARDGDRVTGVVAAGLTVRAQKVVVACGSIQTPALMARSGLGSPQLGRNLAMHPNACVAGFFDHQVTGWQGAHQAFQVREFAAEGIILTANNLAPPLLAALLPAHGRELGALMADYNKIVTAAPLIEDAPAGRVRVVPGLGAQVFYRLSDMDAARVVRGVALTAELLFAAGARRLILPFDGAPQISSMDELRAVLSRPVPKRDLRLFSIHLMGTARMSERPGRGVVDSYGRVHGLTGLYISDASIFPTPTGVNPMETVVALSARNARHLIRNWAPASGISS